MVAIIQYPIYGSHEAPVDICMPQVDKYGIPLDALFSLYHFFIPLSFTTYNYIKLWLQSQQLRRNSLSYRKHHQINIFFSRLMIACLVEFVICQLPFDIVLGIAWFQEYTKQMTLQSTSIFLGFILVYSDSVVNPLWFSFVALKRPCSKNGVARRTNLNLVQTSANPSALDESNWSFTNWIERINNNMFCLAECWRLTLWIGLLPPPPHPLVTFFHTFWTNNIFSKKKLH